MKLSKCVLILSVFALLLAGCGGGGGNSGGSPTPTDTNFLSSPDGRSVAFLRRASGNANDIWVKNADGTGARLLYKTPFAMNGDIVWSDDNHHVAFRPYFNYDDTSVHIYKVDTATASVSRVYEPQSTPFVRMGILTGWSSGVIHFTARHTEVNTGQAYDKWQIREDGSGLMQE